MGTIATQKDDNNNGSNNGDPHDHHDGGEKKVEEGVVVAANEDDEDQKKKASVLTTEMMFKDVEVPTWREQLTVRALVVSMVLGVFFSIIVMKFSLTTGVIPSLNVSAGLLGFFFVKTWTKFLDKTGWLRQPFTRQENTYGYSDLCRRYLWHCLQRYIGGAGGFGSYLFGMSEVVAGQSTEANDPSNVKDPNLKWMIGFLFLVSFLGLFSVVPLRKIMIIDFKLIYPSGTATSHLINSFHTPHGGELARKQVKTLGKFFSFSFLWGFFQWFFKAGSDCGFENFPTFGLKAYDNRFYFDFSASYVGVGMICPYIINISLLVGAILSWGLMWPLIQERRGDWYTEPSQTNLKGIQGYRVFIAIAMILGDGLYNFVKVVATTMFALYQQLKKRGANTVLPLADRPVAQPETVSYDDERRTRLFLSDQIPTWVALSGYVGIAAISVGTLPLIFPQLKWYHVLIIYIFAPALAFCNSYGCGLTDWSLASTYGKLAIFVIGAWAGKSDGGVIAGLAACGVMMNIVSTASDLMQDFKTGYMTLASPRAMFVSQVIGTAMGCVIAPCVFWMYYKAFHDLGKPHTEYPAPYALAYRNMSILGVEGFSSLPKNCLVLCCVFFAGAIVINFVRDVTPKKWSQFIPLPMAMAIPFYIGSYFAIDMCVGSLILFVWEKLNKAEADAFGPAVASGLICGDGLWTVPSSVLALAKVKSPICMKFLSSEANKRVDDFLGS